MADNALPPLFPARAFSGSENGLIHPDAIPVARFEAPRDIRSPLSRSLEEQLAHEDELVPVPLSINPDVIFELDAEGIQTYEAVLEAYLQKKGVDPSTMDVSTEEIFKMTYELISFASGEHVDDLPTPAAKDTLNLDSPPPTKCNIFNSAYIHMFDLLSRKMGREDVPQKYRLLLTPANYINHDVTGTIWHAHIALVTADSDGTLHTSLIDPYHAETDEGGPAEISALDFTEDRGTDALISLLKRREVRHTITTPGFLSSLSQQQRQILARWISIQSKGSGRASTAAGHVATTTKSTDLTHISGLLRQLTHPHQKTWICCMTQDGNLIYSFTNVPCCQTTWTI
ncbi:MAG: hypothetical protein TR69_WS6001001321 [candidate division WS6 bacterium OLB20]|uniref:Uncharacterized protein n=1 Tax=candidate division WS6 bacterium OLB20 TaxID=1617426 RepID=A0A136LWK7_9BACT|nr:MAG: hypothetical protein TR69_WS6001001321 [candidate division WS6 bacterium OLB20]